MTDKKDLGSEGGTVKSAPKKLQLTKTIKTGLIQQNFAHGRSRNVAVEVKRTRTFSKNGSGDALSVKIDKEQPVAEDTLQDQSSHLTRKEQEARVLALKNMDHTDHSFDPSSVVQKIAVEQKLQEEAEKLEAAQLAAKKAAAENHKADKKDDSQTDSTKKEDAAPVKVVQPVHRKKERSTDKHSEKQSHSKKIHLEKHARGKLTISNAFDQDDSKVRSLAAIKRARQKAKRQKDMTSDTQERMIREVVIPETIQVQELANRMAVRSQEVVKELMKLGIMASGDKEIDADTAELVVAELGHTSKRVTDADVEDILKDEIVDDSELEHRPPIVTIMGHVDHGKTSLLDALRSTNVTEGEAGGITQHIGAYQIKASSGDKITFLDTPGHAAFTAMRARGAEVTDIVVLVVAADDGVMPQTIEAINHAKAAEVPIIVAVNKIDKPEADSSKVRNELLQYELISEDLGGDTMIVEISALKNINLDKLIELILLQAEMLEMKASIKQRAEGTVVETEIDKGKGIVATLLVQRGTLRIGDIVVAGASFGRVKAIRNDKGSDLKEAIPSLPVEVLGLNELPDVGDGFAVVKVEKQAREIVDYRRKQQRDLRSEDKSLSIEKLFQNANGKKELCVIIKGDVQGSVEAIMGSLEKVSNDEINIKFIHTGAGGITESDVTLASAVNALILGFNVRASSDVREIAGNESVDIRYYSIIYNLIDDVKSIVSGMMSPIVREEFLGNAEIKEVFKMSKGGKVAGCMITEGTAKRGASVRLVRDNVVIHEGKLKTLRRFKDEVQEVKNGMECGMAFENYDDIKQGDVIESFNIIEEKVEL